MIVKQVHHLDHLQLHLSTQKVDTRARARAVSLKDRKYIMLVKVGKLGTFRLDTQPDGRTIMAKIVQVFNKTQ